MWTSCVKGLRRFGTIAGLGKIIVTSPGKRSVRCLIWVDMVWPWVIAYDLWNHAFLYNSLADYTWYCTLALLLACTIPALTWPVDLVPLLHPGFLDLDEHAPARDPGAAL